MRTNNRWVAGSHAAGIGHGAPSRFYSSGFLPNVTSPSFSMTTVTFVVLMCYRGGFGTTPAFTADYLGPKNVGPIYGLVLTAWGFASAFGPLFIAHMRETAGLYSGALRVIAGVMAVSTLLPV